MIKGDSANGEMVLLNIMIRYVEVRSYDKS